MDYFGTHGNHLIETRFIKKGQLTFFLEELSDHRNDIKGLTYPFTYVGTLCFPSFSLEEKHPHPRNCPVLCYT